MTRAIDEEFEFELRCLPGVMNVGLSATASGTDRLVVVVRRQDVDHVRTEAPAITSLYAPDLELEVTARDEVGIAGVDAGTDAVRLRDAHFDPAEGAAEVTLTYGGTTATARSESGPLIGGAAATLEALRDLGHDLPVYLMSVTKVDTSPALPVVVTLRSRESGEDYVGVGQTGEDVRSAATAALDALARSTSLRI